MGLFGGGNASTSSTTNNATNNLDNRIVSGNDSNVFSNASNNTVTNNSTDYGAINSAIQLASIGILSNEHTNTNALNQIASAYSEARNNSEGNNTFKWLAGGAVVLVAIAVIGKRT